MQIEISPAEGQKINDTLDGIQKFCEQNQAHIREVNTLMGAARRSVGTIIQNVEVFSEVADQDCVDLMVQENISTMKTQLEELMQFMDGTKEVGGRMHFTKISPEEVKSELTEMRNELNATFRVNGGNEK